MKALNRELSLLEKIILALMVIFLIALLYYYFIDQPIKRETEELQGSIDEYSVINPALEAKVAELQQIEASLQEIEENGGTLEKMESYNNGNAETDFLHQVLQSSESYNISFSNVTRDGNLIRRTVSIIFRASDYDTAEEILKEISDCEYRCLISDVSMTSSDEYYNTVDDGKITVNCTATFYETMVGGTNDEGLPVAQE